MNNLYIPLRSYKTANGELPDFGYFSFISHYVHIKLQLVEAIRPVVDLYIPLRSYKTESIRISYESNVFLYIPLRSYKTRTALRATLLDATFISHYVHIKLCTFSSPNVTLFLYIPLRSYKTDMSGCRTISHARLYIPLRSYKTQQTSASILTAEKLYIPLRSYKTKLGQY